MSPNSDLLFLRLLQSWDFLLVSSTLVGGSPWVDEEVDRFYKAYRKYGKDWKKVAAMVRTRNSEMVEALYTMNRAYLSLPEETASVVGFIAMVSYHYDAMIHFDM